MGGGSAMVMMARRWGGVKYTSRTYAMGEEDKFHVVNEVNFPIRLQTKSFFKTNSEKSTDGDEDENEEESGDENVADINNSCDWKSDSSSGNDTDGDCVNQNSLTVARKTHCPKCLNMMTLYTDDYVYDTCLICQWIGDITHNGSFRLKSRKPAHISMRKLIADRYDGLADWKSEWEKSNPDTHNIIQSLGNPLPGHQLPRREWVVLNRLRTELGRCKELLQKWKMADLPDCDCGHPSQTIHHIIKDCPLRAFKGSMRELHHATVEAINWIKALDIIL
ncbi:hypothetical protein QTP88_002290 [Uroleucon formosanum]